MIERADKHGNYWSTIIAWRNANPEKVKEAARKHLLRKAYGLSREEYFEMLDTQGGECAVCGVYEQATYRGKPKEMAVDHDHTTGKVRGLLCTNCNRAIGMMQDSPELLEQAALYLRAQEEVNAGSA